MGNNIPVFFIRDGAVFPELVHALRPNPKNHIQEGWRILDFLAHHPESTHMVNRLFPAPLGLFVKDLLFKSLTCHEWIAAWFPACARGIAGLCSRQ